MSGHSKWSTIKRQKGITDAKRGASFTKLANNISMAVREGGGGDINFNFRLRLAVDKARAANMPKENIARAIDRGLGKGDSAALESLVYEGFAPHGVALLIESVTDNKNRTNGEVKTLLSKAGGSLGSSGSASYLFTHKGEIVIAKNKPYDEVLELAMEAGAEDLVEGDAEYYLYTQPADLHKTKIALESRGVVIESAQLTYVPNKETIVVISDETQAESVLKIVEALEELDDVQNVYSNLG